MFIALRAALFAIILALTFAAPTAPARELDAPTLLVMHRFNINVVSNSMQIYHDYLLLLPDGTAYENTPQEGMKNVTAAKLAQESKERPYDLGKWKRITGGPNGDGIETTFTRSVYDSQLHAARGKVEVASFQKTAQGGWSKDGKHENWNTYAPVIALDAKKLLGPWELDEKVISAGTATGNLPMITVVRARDYTFYADGKFIASSSQIASASASVKNADGSRFVASTYDQSPTTAERGSYKLDADNHALVLTEANGKTRTVTAFILPLWGTADKKPTIIIDGQRLHHPEPDANAAQPAPQKPAPVPPAAVAGSKFAHFRFELPKGWSQSEVDDSLMLRPEGGVEKGVGILLLPPGPHKGDQDLESFDKWFEATRIWLDEDRTVLESSKPADRNQGRYPMRVQIEVVKKPDQTTQARVYIGVKRGDRHAELLVMFGPDIAAVTPMMDTLDKFLSSITLEAD
jgi:hypothetical protein